MGLVHAEHGRVSMRTLISLFAAVGCGANPTGGLGLPSQPDAAEPDVALPDAGLPPDSARPPMAGGVQIYGAWHCGNDACTWSSVRDMADFDRNNHWILDRGDGAPSFNLIILSFANPLKVLDRTSDAQTTRGVPIGITPEIVGYFAKAGIRVMLSIGGITYTKDWDTALATDGAKLGRSAAAIAQELGVGIEIASATHGAPPRAALQAFIDAYRSQLPYDATGANPAARLTIDLAAGTRWMVRLAAKATSWLDVSNPALDYANAMVAGRSQPDASATQAQWLEHVQGNARMTPPIPPLAPAKLTGSIWMHGDSAECRSFAGSVTEGTSTFVQTVAPTVGETAGLLGYMFWAAECEGTKTVCTTPPNSCERGVGAGAAALGIPVPMPALRQR